MPMITHEGNSVCATGSYIAFDVDDTFAFDIDRNVTLTVRVNLHGATEYFFAYDKNGQAETYERQTRAGDGCGQ